MKIDGELDPIPSRPILGSLLWLAGEIAVGLCWFLWWASLFVLLGVLPSERSAEWLLDAWNSVGGRFTTAYIMVATAALARLAIPSAMRLRAAANNCLPFDVNTPFVLYLHAFAHDGTLHPCSGPISLFSGGLLMQLFMPVSSEEDDLIRALKPFGPVVAIGKPGERLPFAGARRLYVRDSNWKNVVTKLMDKARLTIINSSISDGTIWEIKQAATRLEPDKLVFFLSDARMSELVRYGPDPEACESFYSLFRFVAHNAGIDIPDSRTGSHFIWFDQDRRPVFSKAPADVLTKRTWNGNKKHIFTAELRPLLLRCNEQLERHS